MIVSKKSSHGADEIPCSLLVLMEPFVSGPLLHILNRCFDDGVYPDSMKLARVVPLYKNGAKEAVSNYRPISIISVFAKVFDEIIYNRLMDFLLKSEVFSDSQFGFLPGRSTIDAISNVMEEVYRSLDENSYAIGLFFDCSKAFDLIQHKYLLETLSSVGIRGTALRLMESYLTNRKQAVAIRMANKVNLVQEVCSDVLSVGYGVGQGSKLGPLLFVLEVNDAAERVRKGLMTQFVDDTSNVFSGKVMTEVINDANAGAAELFHWAKSKCIKMNDRKTIGVHFSVAPGGTQYSPLVKTSGGSIHFKSSVKFLGLHISSDLRWQHHIDYLAGRLCSTIFLLKKLQLIMNEEILRMIYFGKFQSSVYYAIMFWGNSSDAKRILLLQKKAVRAMYRLKPRDSCRPYFKSKRILTIPALYVYCISCFFYNRKKSFATFDHHYDTRNKHNFIYPKPNHSFFTSSYQFMGLKISNSLPSEVLNATSLKAFKTKLKLFLLDNPIYDIEEFFLLVT